MKDNFEYQNIEVNWCNKEDIIKKMDDEGWQQRYAAYLIGDDKWNPEKEIIQFRRWKGNNNVENEGR